MRLEFELSAPTPSNNQLLRMHWSNRRRLKNDTAWEVNEALGALGFALGYRKFGKVNILRIGKKLLDPDNLYGGAKLLIDALTLVGLIEDDSPAHIELTVRQKVGKPPRTVVELEST